MGDRRPTIVLDAGAFVAFERRSPTVSRYLDFAELNRVVAVTSAAVVAQVHRGDPRQAVLNGLLKSRTVLEAPLDSTEARLIGASLSGIAKPDVVDAHVALLALRHDATVLTSDRKDIERLGVSADRIVDC